jgi:hypothetical protein
MIITDNGSWDETVPIINSMIAEGYPVLLIEGKERDFQQKNNMNDMMTMAFRDHGADWVIPLDADEFVITVSGAPPGDVIGRLDPLSLHFIKWRTYLPEDPNVDCNKMIPARMTMARTPGTETFSKVLVSRYVHEAFRPQFTAGNHNVVSGTDTNPGKTMQEDLKIAHYPIRSINQCRSKVLSNWLMRKHVGGSPNQSFHWKLIYDHIKESGNLDYETILHIAKHYDMRDWSLDVGNEPCPIEDLLPVDKDLKHTTSNPVNWLKNLLKTMESIIELKSPVDP